jgi:iron-sulfur cluster assembly accessory protein
MVDQADKRCACGKRNKCPLDYGETVMAFPQKTPMLVRRDPPETDDGRCHMTPILDGVEGIGFECNGVGPVMDRTLKQLHFAAIPKENVLLELSEKAAKVLKKVIRRDIGKAKGVRLSLIPSGCAELQFKFDLASEAGEGETTVEVSGVPIFVNQSAAGLIKGTLVDYVENLEGGNFIFKNPNATSTCGCGQSFNLSRPQ